MTKSELCRQIRRENANLSPAEVRRIVDLIFGAIADHLAHGGRVELRGVGAFSLRTYGTGATGNPSGSVAVHYRKARSIRFRSSRLLRLASG